MKLGEDTPTATQACIICLEPSSNLCSLQPRKNYFNGCNCTEALYHDKCWDAFQQSNARHRCPTCRAERIDIIVSIPIVVSNPIPVNRPINTSRRSPCNTLKLRSFIIFVYHGIVLGAGVIGFIIGQMNLLLMVMVSIHCTCSLHDCISNLLDAFYLEEESDFDHSFGVIYNVLRNWDMRIYGEQYQHKCLAFTLLYFWIAVLRLPLFILTCVLFKDSKKDLYATIVFSMSVIHVGLVLLFIVLLKIIITCSHVIQRI